MTQRISSEAEEKTGHARSLIQRYGDSIEANSQLLETASKTMEEPDLAAFVQVCVCVCSCVYVQKLYFCVWVSKTNPKPSVSHF